MSSHIVGPDLSPANTPMLVPKPSSALHIVGGGPAFARHSSSSAPHVSAHRPVEDLRHAHVRLDARPGSDLGLSTWSDLLSCPPSPANPRFFSRRQYRTPRFARQLLEIINALQVPSWTKSALTPDALAIRKVSGSLTNAVFFVSSPGSLTLLLRIYGPSSGELISRPRELHTLHVLSSKYRLGPRVYGTFDNGRVEQYFESVTLTAADIRNPKISSHIGARMAELHSVDIAAIEPAAAPAAGADLQIGAEKNVHSWLPHARHVLVLPSIRDSIRAELDLARFQTTWDAYMKWLRDREQTDGASKRVFCHNDAQYGNLLKLHAPKEGTPEHHQIIVVDFEYASPNPAAFDIANHFHEWTADYHGPAPHVLDPARYPTPAQRRTFYLAYLAHCTPPLPSGSSAAPPLTADAREREVAALERHVRAWSPASHAMWAVWGIVQAREDVEAGNPAPEFDYIGYARCRMAAFYREVAALMPLP